LAQDIGIKSAKAIHWWCARVMAALLVSVIALCYVSSPAAEVLKVGAVLQTTGSMASTADKGKQAIELWANWVNSSSSMNFTVELSFSPANDISADVAAMTAQGPDKVDVLFCPYGSGGSSDAILAVDADFTGPIIVWGGASDDLFDTDCVDKTCLGFFTKASEYMTTGIQELDSAYVTGTSTVALIENNNGFSTNVCDGLNATIAQAGGLFHRISVSTSEKSSLPAEDAQLIQDVIDTNADIVAICGHNGFVEPVIVQIGNASNYTPRAILATNSLTSTATTNFGSDAALQVCLMMPTQWAESDVTPDSIIGWDSTAFKAALGNAATYHSAAAAAAGIAITHAMGGGITDLAELMQDLDIQSFYGQLKFASDGSIEGKPMYTQQKQSYSSPMVAPSGDALLSGVANTELSTCPRWLKTTTAQSTTPMFAVNGARSAFTETAAPLLALMLVVNF